MSDVGTAQEVADWYEAITGYRFHPTVIGQLYARSGLRPEMAGESKIYNGPAIFCELEALRARRALHEANT